jgi:pyrrolidone-carboxylate peptidase
MVITAFRPFGRFDHNPSEILAKHVFGDRAVILPVCFSAVDDFVGKFPPGENQLLMLGVSSAAKDIRVEHVASGAIGDLPDIEGIVRARAEAARLNGTLLIDVPRSDLWSTSHDAGNYLCNYLFFEALSKLPHVQSAFVHIPPFTNVPLQIQALRMRRLLAKANLAS